MRESFMLDTIDDRLGKQRKIPINDMNGISASSRFCKRIRIERKYFIPLRSGSGFDVKRSRRRCLTGSQAIILIICDDIGQIDIPSAGMEKMAQSDTISISITSIDYDRHVRLSELEAGSERKSPSMKRLASISIDILAYLAGASDSGDDSDLMLWDIQLFESVLYSGMNHEIPASRASLYLSQTGSHYLIRL